MNKALALVERRGGWALLVMGGISATGFAPLNLWPLTLLGLMLLMHLVARADSGRRAFWLGWLFGLGHFTIGNNWIATAFTYQANMPAWLGWLAVPLLALYLALYPGLAAWGAWRITKIAAPTQTSSAGTPFILAFAGCWIIAEWLRSWVFTGFAWNPIAAAWVDTLFAQFWLPTFGTYGFSGIFALAAGLLLMGFTAMRRGLRSGAPLQSGSVVGIGFIAIFALPLLGAALFPNLLLPAPKDAPPTSPTSLTIVQPNISQIDKYKPGYDAVNFQRLAESSLPQRPRPRLILWPEAAIPWRLEEGYPFRFYQFQPGESAAGARTMLSQLMNPADILLTGADRLEFDSKGQLVGARNSVHVMTGTGNLLGHYDKAHLVPFGEYLALRWLLEPLGATRLVPGTIDFWSGPGPRTLDLPFDGRRVKVGMQICYEMIFSGKVTDHANRPDFIFNPSNDAWFGHWGPPQHLAQARLRAIEEGLPVVRSTPTGISAVIDADGRIVKNLPPGIAGRIDAQLPLAKSPTLFASFGNILPLGFALLLLVCALLPLARTRLSR
ncbi:MAG: apolipoprotein N-acyltransferase [Sphingobium sp.]|nr:MAG: apolipoprotein N-acyltransferase [Sphingobium sp.]